MMVSIDYIMSLLDWNNSTEQQTQGIELAKRVKCLNVFLQPNNTAMGKMFGGIAQKFYLQDRMRNYLHT